MKRIYKIKVRPEDEAERILVLECKVNTHAETPSEVFSGITSVLKDGSFRIWDYYPEVDYDQSSSDWSDFFQIISLTPVGHLKCIRGYEVFIHKKEVDD